MKDFPTLRNCGGRVDVLIGMDHANIITPSESRFGRDCELTASKTRLRWTLQGSVDVDGKPNVARVHQVFVSVEVGLWFRKNYDVSVTPSH